MICLQEVENDEESEVSSDEEGEEGEDGGNLRGSYKSFVNLLK